MDFLTKILAIDAPENTRLVWPPEPTFRGLTPGWMIALALLMLVGLALVVFFYIRENGTLGPIRRIFLIGLRCALLFFLLFLILRPILLLEFRGDKPRGVALLIDNSQSMEQRDRRLTDGDKARVAISLGKLPLATAIKERMPELPDVSSNPPRKDIVKNVLSLPDLKLIPSLQRHGTVRMQLFGKEPRSTSADHFAKEYTTQEPQTALADNLLRIVEAKDADLPSAIVVVTDGQDNASKYTILEAAEKCRDAKVPLHIYGVGTAEGGQLQLKEVIAPDTLFIDDTVTIPVRWRAQGFKQGTIEVTLTLGGKELARKVYKLQTGEDLRDALTFTVPKDIENRDAQDLVATIRYKVGDAVLMDDTLTRTVRVSDAKIRVLYVEHGPRWEYQFLQPALLRDRRIEADFILVNAAKEVSTGGRPFLPEFPKTREKFFEAKYNLIILGDVASSYFTKEQMEWIKEFVQNRGGLIVMAGRQNMPSSYENTPIADVLPIEFKKEKFGIDSEVRTQEYPPTLTDAGQRADWLALADTPEENLDIWQTKLLGFHWNYPVTKLKPAATSLVVNPRAAKIGDPPAPMPVMATHTYGKGSVLWMGTDETWRWRWNYQDKYFVRIWGQIIYQMGLPSMLGDSTRRAQMALDRSRAVVGTEPTKIYVTLLDKDFNPRKDPKVDAELVYLDAKPGEDPKRKVDLNAQAGRPGEYIGYITNDRAGRFELHVKNPDDNAFAFRVELPAKHELEESGLNEKVLRDAAQLSGGRFYREEDLHQLASSIVTQTQEFTLRQEVLLWNPLAIFVFLGLITIEWIVRKLSDLS